MKKAIIIICLLFISLNIYGFKEDLEKERILTEIDQLKNVKGTLITGNGKVYMDGAFGKGPLFNQLAQQRDFYHIMQLNVDFMAVPIDIMKCGATLKFENDVSGFWGVGDSLSMRELYGEFVLLGFIDIRAGTIYEKYTPFTIYAPVNIIPMGCELFYLYFENDLYDNLLHHKDKFPLEGMTMDAKFSLANALLQVTGTAAKIDDSAAAGNSYHRYLFGSQIAGEYDTVARLKLSWVEIRDLVSTGSNEYNDPLLNDVMSVQFQIDVADLLFSPEKSLIKSIGVESELALSIFQSNQINPDSKPVNGKAIQGTAFVNYNNMIQIEGGYRGVEFEFVSPAAQSRMASPRGSEKVFQSADLYPFLFNYYFYNRIRLARDDFDVLNSTYPMNEATPNRIGVFGDIIVSTELVWAKAGISDMEEVRPIAAPNENRRTFSRIESIISFDLPVFLNIRYIPEITGFYVIENTKRDDWAGTSGKWLDESENFKSLMQGVEANFKLFKSLSIIGTYQIYKISGPKVFDIYYTHSPLTIDSYNQVNYKNYKNTLIGAGVIHQVSRVFQIQADYFYKEFIDFYSIEQGRLLVNIKF